MKGGELGEAHLYQRVNVAGEYPPLPKEGGEK